MSYEGNIRYLCQHGHLHEWGCYDAPSNSMAWNCPICTTPQVWWEGVDQTNDAGDQTVLQVHKPAETSTCEHCGLSKELAPVRYCVPSNSGHRKGEPLVPVVPCRLVLNETGEEFDTDEELSAAHTALWEQKEDERREMMASLKDEVVAAVLKEQEPKEIFLREDVSDEEAKQEIHEYIEQHPGTDAADIHLELLLDFGQVRRLCDELQEEGLIEWDDEGEEKEQTS